MAKRPKVSLLQFTFLSKYIGRQQTVNLYLPYGCYSAAEQAQRPYKVLWLLHGKSDDYNTWLRNSVAETIARENDLAVVMPDAGNSFYTDMAYGPAYYTYITEEIPEVLYGLLPLSQKKEDNFLCGFSMGGYGTLKIGLSHPERFAALCAMSSAADIVELMAGRAEPVETPADGSFSEAEFNRTLAISVFGDELDRLKGSKHDLFALFDRANEKGVQPPVYMTCGTEDGLIKGNDKLYAYCHERGYDVTYETGPGAHDWNVWNRDIQQFIRFLKERGLLDTNN